jgi:serine/threonine-protein kinase
VGVPLADIAYMIGGRWSDDGGIVFADAARGLFRVESTGGTVEQLVSATEPGQVFGGPDVLPGGEWVLYGQSRRVSPVADFETIAFSRKTRERRVLLENGPAQHMGRYLFYHGGTGTFVVPFDPARAQVTGQAVAIRLGIGLVLADVSRNGTLVYTRIPADVRRVPVWMTRDGKATPLPIEPATYRFPRVSPDGRRLAVSRTDARGLTSDVWLYSIDGTSTTRLTFDGRSGPAVWTSDGRRLAVSVGGSGNSNAAGSQALQLFVQEADGTGRPKRLTDNRNNRYPFAWFAGNTRLLFLELAANALDIGVLDTTTGNARMLLSSAANETRPDASPDGQWLAYTSNESGRDEIYVRPLQDVESGKWQVSTAGGHSPVWMPGGRELAYRAPGKMMIVTVHAGSPFRFDTPRPLFDDHYVNDIGGRSYDVSPDGRFLLLEDDESSVDQIEVIVNWFEELRRLMQAR